MCMEIGSRVPLFIEEDANSPRKKAEPSMPRTYDAQLPLTSTNRRTGPGTFTAEATSRTRTSERDATLAGYKRRIARGREQMVEAGQELVAQLGVASGISPSFSSRHPASQSKVNIMRDGALALALVGICAACSQQSSNPCSPVDTNANCNVQSPAVTHQYDDVRGCLMAAAPVRGLCVGSTVNGPCQAASVGLGCAIAPDGGIFVISLNGSQYVWGAGWRSSSDVAAGAEEGRCQIAECSPSCDGTPLDDLHGRICRDAASEDGWSD